jgi:hypothetical protein
MKETWIYDPVIRNKMWTNDWGLVIVIEYLASVRDK